MKATSHPCGMPTAASGVQAAESGAPIPTNRKTVDNPADESIVPGHVRVFSSGGKTGRRPAARPLSWEPTAVSGTIEA